MTSDWKRVNSPGEAGDGRKTFQGLQHTGHCSFMGFRGSVSQRQFAHQQRAERAHLQLGT
jgi:hypothetical protein